MEKIYMEENQKNRKNGKNTFPIFLSMIIAVIAIVSLVVVGFDQVSYAAEPTEDTEETDLARQTLTFSKGTPDMIQFVGNGYVFPVTMYYDGDGKPVFCVERRIQEYGANQVHTVLPVDNIPNSLQSNGVNITNGITYILNNYNTVFGDIKSGTLPSGMENIDQKVVVAAAQAAIWVYLADVQSGNSEIFNRYHTLASYDGTTDGSYVYSSDEMRSAIVNVTSFKSYTIPSGASPVTEDITGINARKVSDGITSLVNGAKNADDSNSNVLSLNIAIEGNSTKLTATSDNNFYRSNNIVVTNGGSFGELHSFDVVASGIDGVKVLDSTTNTEKTHYNAGEKFYIQIPADKVTSSVQNIHVDVNGTFNYSVARYYVLDEVHQRITSLEPSVVTIENSRRLDVVGTPNTSMSAVQTIYFIGLIVLLCGIGIIYANAKPVEEK